MVLVAMLMLASACTLAASHCKSGEIIYFSCPIKGSEKLVSLCGSAFRDKGRMSETAWVQYRFGRPGQIELAYPKQKSSLVEAFTGEYIVANDRRLYSLMFHIGAHKYELLVSPEFRGVTVSGNDTEAKRPCSSEPQTQFAKSLNNFYQLVQDLGALEDK